MRKLLLTCECGQQMQVPRSAIGKVGLCPSCGRTTRISAQNTSPLPRGGRGQFFARKTTWGAGQKEPPESAKQRFGQAVDHFYAQRYAEAMAIFDGLLKEFPGNPDLEHGRAQCIKAMNRPALPAPGPGQTGEAGLNEETVRRIVLEKLLYGSTDAVQVQAADVAAKILGMYPGTRTEKPDSGTTPLDDHADDEDDAPVQTLGDNVTPFRDSASKG